MTYVLGRASLAELDGVHPTLVAVVKRAIQMTAQDFSVHDGLRTEAEQREYVRRGVSKTMESKHRRQADGFGHAVDLVPYVNGKLRWEWPLIYPIAAAMRLASQELAVELTWGGVWDRAFKTIEPTAKGCEQAVAAYTARRRAMGKSAFLDGPHYELRP